MSDECAARRAPPRGDLTADQVAAYLREHPDYFVEHESLLAELQLPHPQRGAISLVERQLELLRERQQAERQRLNELVHTASANQRIFDSTLALTLALIDAESAADLGARLERGLHEHFDVNAVTFCAIDAPSLSSEITGAIRVTHAEAAQQALGSLLQSERVVCGVLREAELTFLFPAAAGSLHSAVVMPLPVPETQLLLAMGSERPDHFAPEMDTQLLRFVGEVAARVLLRLGAIVPTEQAGDASS